MSSLWDDTLAAGRPDRPPLTGPAEADVAIVGAGFTGLWTAYYLRRLDPTLRVTVLEAEHAGFGASGRNGGWCSALFPTPWRRLGPGALRLHQVMQETVAEVGRVCTAEGIDADFAHGGTVTLARSGPQATRLRAELTEAHAHGFTETDLRWLDADEARARLNATAVQGGLFTPHCAAVHPGRLVQGLARVVGAAGVRIHERTPVTAIEPGRARTAAGDVRAEVVVRATEGWTARLPGQRRRIAPVYSLMVATEPLPASVWQEIGLEGRPTFTDGRHVIVYGQRTADDRIAFGGRGAPYHFGSTIKPGYDDDPHVHALLRATLRDLLPAIGGARFTHAWGGPLGIARDWAASVDLDRATGLAHAGGYVGDGVGTSNLAGRTLADLILRRDTELTTLPWVGHRSPRWEPEPLRWLGANAGLQAMHLADTEETRTGRPSRIARILAPLMHG